MKRDVTSPIVPRCISTVPLSILSWQIKNPRKKNKKKNYEKTYYVKEIRYIKLLMFFAREPPIIGVNFATKYIARNQL